MKNPAIERTHREWKLSNLISVIHYSLGVSGNYSLFFLSSCWLFIIHNHFFITPLTSCVIHYSWFSKLKYSLFIFYSVPLFIIQLPAPKIRYKSLVLTDFITWNRRQPHVLRELLISPPVNLPVKVVHSCCTNVEAVVAMNPFQACYSLIWLNNRTGTRTMFFSYWSHWNSNHSSYFVFYTLKNVYQRLSFTGQQWNSRDIVKQLNYLRST